MKKIIVRIKPYQIEQSLIVLENGNKIDIQSTTMNTLNQDVFQLMDKHKCYRLDLAGPRKYMSGLANQIQVAKANSKFNLKDLEINII